jgi:hypothetical protein
MTGHLHAPASLSSPNDSPDTCGLRGWVAPIAGHLPVSELRRFMTARAYGLSLQWKRSFRLHEQDSSKMYNLKYVCTCSRLWGFCTVCKISLPTTFREPLWVPKRRQTYLTHRAKTPKPRISIRSTVKV